MLKLSEHMVRFALLRDVLVRGARIGAVLGFCTFCKFSRKCVKL